MGAEAGSTHAGLEYLTLGCVRLLLCPAAPIRKKNELGSDPSPPVIEDALMDLRAFEWSLSRWMRLAPLEDPGKDERDPLDITLRQDRLARFWPAVAHQIVALP